MKTDRLNQLLNMLSERPDEPFLLFAIAREYQQKGEEKMALETYVKLKETHPAYTGLYYHLGKLYEQLNQKKNAIQTYQQGIRAAQKTGAAHDMQELQGALALIDDEA